MNTTPSELLRQLQYNFQGFYLDSSRWGTCSVSTDQESRLRMLNNALRTLPRRLYPSDFRQRNLFEHVLTTIDDGVEGRRPNSQHRMKVWGQDSKNALALLEDLLKEMPDVAASPDDQRLLFISDQDHRSDLITDWDAAGHLINVGEWKASTVMSGSVIEALLVVGLTQHLNDENYKRFVIGEKSYYGLTMTDLIVEARGMEADRARKKGYVKTHLSPLPPPKRLLDDSTAELLKDHAAPYRNLIHHARTIREQMKPGPDTAHIVYGAVHRVAVEMAEALCANS